jgi:hypothetical protein
MGKTALAIYMKHQVNDGYGKNYFGGDEKILYCYVSFQKQIKSKIEFLYKEVFASLIRDGIFSHISDCVSKGDLINAGVQEDFGEAMLSNSVKKYLESLSRYKLEEMSTAYDQKFLIKLPDLFLNQTIRALQTAGFKGGILLIDDVENLTEKSTKKEIENFIKDFGIAFFRAGYEVRNFFTIILTTHDQSARQISEAWTVAGLSAAFPLNERSHVSILVPKPDMEQCIDIVTQYLEHYRDRSFATPTKVHPFKRDAVGTVVEECNYHPRRFLSRFNRIIVEALSKDVKEITSEFVKTVPEIEEEEALGIEQL